MKSAFFVLAFAACGYSPDLGTTPFLCGNGTPPCPDGYACVASGAAMVCSKSDGTGPDGGDNTGCADDSSLEPNNTISNAYLVPSPLPMNGGAETITYSGLAICPSSDVDTYRVVNDKIATLTASIEFDATATPLTVNMLAMNGSVSKMGASTAAGKADVSINLAQAGVVSFVQVTPTTAGNNPNYKLVLTLQ